MVPGYQEMFDLVAEACLRYVPQEAKLIDLGCGTGNAVLAVLLRNPSSKVCLIDSSESMANVALERISRLPWGDPGWQGDGPSLESIGRRAWRTRDMTPS